MSSGYRILLVVYEGIMYSLGVNMVIEQLYRFLFHFDIKLRMKEPLISLIMKLFSKGTDNISQHTVEVEQLNNIIYSS